MARMLRGSSALMVMVTRLELPCELPQCSTSDHSFNTNTGREPDAFRTDASGLHFFRQSGRPVLGLHFF
jgi:hypothetical protein